MASPEFRFDSPEETSEVASLTRRINKIRARIEALEAKRDTPNPAA